MFLFCTSFYYQHTGWDLFRDFLGGTLWIEIVFLLEIVPLRWKVGIEAFVPSRKWQIKTQWYKSLNTYFHSRWLTSVYSAESTGITFSSYINVVALIPTDATVSVCTKWKLVFKMAKSFADGVRHRRSSHKFRFRDYWRLCKCVLNSSNHSALQSVWSAIILCRWSKMLYRQILFQSYHWLLRSPFAWLSN